MKHVILSLQVILFVLLPALSQAQNRNLSQELIIPPREFSVMPFWFWNDDLKDDEIIRQIADFEAHMGYTDL
jgi:hypothetical protein